VQLIIDLWLAPNDWREQLAALNMRWERWQAQPIADSIQLIGVTNIPKQLPEWIIEERANETNVD
jgi:hypothetical protein